jgi:protein TonB
MFEDSTFESSGKIHTRSRAWMIATFVFNSVILLALVLIPLFYPEALPQLMNTIMMVAPAPQPQPPQPPPPRQPVRMNQALETMNRQLRAPRLIPTTPYIPDKPESQSPGPIAEWNTAPSGRNLRIFREHQRPAVRAASQPPARVSGGVMDGLLIGKVMPVYPPLARAMGMEGTVVLQATISKTGTIENLRVVSGPELLRKAAMDAVSRWRYRPYLLNGEPVEVETTINVNFTMH